MKIILEEEKESGGWRYQQLRIDLEDEKGDKNMETTYIFDVDVNGEVTFYKEESKDEE